MTRCAGTSKVPTNILIPIRYFHAHRRAHASGLAVCNDCGRPIATRVSKDNSTILRNHNREQQKVDQRRRRHGEMYRAMHSFVGAPTPIPYAGPVRQTWTAQNPIGVTPTGAGGSVRYQSAFGTPVTMTTNSFTQWNGHYVVEVNNYRYASNEMQVRFLTDTATWSTWNQQWTISTNAMTVNQTTWSNWTGNIITYDAAAVRREVAARGLSYARPVETPEERLERQQREALALFERVEAERLATQTASERALGTLLGLLTAEQRDEYARHGYFHVVGSRGRLYRIHKGSSGNIRRVISKEEQGRGEAAFCVHASANVDRQRAEELGLVPGYLPHEDHMIQQMLHLMIDEDEILGKANLHWGTRQPTDAEIRRFFEAQEASERENALIGSLAPA